MQFLERNIHIANYSLINNVGNSTSIEVKMELIFVVARMDISSAGTMEAVIRQTSALFWKQCFHFSFQCVEFTVLKHVKKFILSYMYVYTNTHFF